MARFAPAQKLDIIALDRRRVLGLTGQYLEKMSREECLRAMAAAPLRLRMGWDELKSLTRE